MHAYSEDYLEHAQQVLGDMMDFAVNTCGMDPDEYFVKFLVTGIAGQFEKGNPRYLSGITGCELVREVMEKSGSPVVVEELCMYPALHEADITKFVSVMDEKMKLFYPETNLKRIRTMSGLSQRELAELSGVSFRQIQLFEQRQRDINKTQVANVVRLAGVLGCRIEDLVER